MTEFNFNEDVAIDLDNLHEEWRAHAQIRYKYAVEVSHLERVMKKAWEFTKVVRSKLIKEAKEKGYGNATLQEAYYRDHDDHKKAKQAQIDAEYDLSMALNALRAFDNRRSALENEVKLWQGNWFAGPREPKEVKPGKRIMDVAKDKRAQQIRTAMNTNRRRRNT